MLLRPEASGARAGRHAAPSDGSLRGLVGFGCGCILVGGLIAAITGPVRLSNGSWLAAYLVLVCGVSSYAIGSVQLRSQSISIPAMWTRLQLGCWILGNAAVTAGTLIASPLLVYVAVVPLYMAIAIALMDSMRPGRHPDRWPSRGALVNKRSELSTARLITWIYRALLVVLAISIPIGAVLAHHRGAA